MLLSMTGYGKADLVLGNDKYFVEIKSLNSKNCDINCKITFALKSEEINIRNILKSKILRGKIDFGIFRDIDNTDSKKSINKELLLSYYKDIKSIASETNEEVNALEMAIRMPDVISAETNTLDEDKLKAVYQAVDAAIEANIDYKTTEGKSIEIDLLEKVNNILNLIPEVEKFEKLRIDSIRQKMKQSFEEFKSEVEIDKNRFEQELIFYIEKLDINEEKQRLTQNCNYFKEILNNEELLKGKKLGFICQEIGREINTMGSKSNNSDMQKIVVQMKDELEKMKEQCLNAL